MNSEKIHTGTGSYDLSAEIQRIGDDLLIAVYGGEVPHIGAVAVAQSHPSRKDPTRKSTSVSVICCQGHKEDQLARKAALDISKATGQNVVVTAGMHWQDLTQEAIRIVENKMEELVLKIRESLC